MRPCSGQLAWALSITTGCLSHGKNVGLKCFLHYDGSPQKSPSTDSVLEAGGDESCLLCHFPSGDGRSALLFLYIGLKQFLKITLDCVCVCAERGGQIPCSWNYSGCWEKNTFFTAERSFQLKTFFSVLNPPQVNFLLQFFSEKYQNNQKNLSQNPRLASLWKMCPAHTGAVGDRASVGCALPACHLCLPQFS